MTFDSNLQTLIWGTEDWVVSAHKRAPSRIADGLLKGQLLSDVYPNFPLLFKVIDAKERLSVQVHPNTAHAALTGGEAKTEMYCFLNDGVVYAGLKPGVGAKEVENAILSGGFEDLMVRHEGKKGDVLFIPGGLIHAIGDNTKIYEVQQSSDTTYRLYDWNRIGLDGQPRELHLVRAIQSIDFSLPPPQLAKSASCHHFDFRQEIFIEPTQITAPANAFIVVYEVDYNKSTLLRANESVLVNPGLVFWTT